MERSAMAEPQMHSHQWTSATTVRNASPIVGLPPDETDQPDLMLQMSIPEKVGAGKLALLAFVIVIIVGVVFYGLNASGW